MKHPLHFRIRKTNIRFLITVFLFLYFFFEPPDLFAQKFRLGLKGSGLVGWIKPDVEGVDVEKFRFGYNYGAICEYLLNDRYVLSSGIDITQKGGGIEDSRKDTLIKETYKLQYMELPLTLKMKTNEINYMTYFGRFGLSTNFNLKARKDVSSIFTGITQTESDRDAKNDIRTIGASMIIGIGAEYAIGEKTSVICDLLLNKGFTNIAKSNGLKMNNSYVALNLGVIF